MLWHGDGRAYSSLLCLGERGDVGRVCSEHLGFVLRFIFYQASTLNHTIYYAIGSENYSLIKQECDISLIISIRNRS